MASAKQEAIKQLGDEDTYIGLNALNAERTNAQNVYNTNVNTLQNAYNDLLKTAENNRNTARTDFQSARSIASQNDYMNNRGVTGADLSNRGLSSGFNQLGKVGSVIQANRANSNLANTYYKSLDEIQNRIDTGTNDYNIGLETAKNDLNALLADIGSREAAQRNNYRQQVAALAEQIQSRWDTQSYYNAQKKLIQNQIAKNNAELELAKATAFKNMIKDPTNVEDINAAVQKYMNTYGTNYNDTLKWFNDHGVIDVNKLKSSSSKSSSSKASSSYLDRTLSSIGSKVSSSLGKLANLLNIL